MIDLGIYKGRCAKLYRTGQKCSETGYGLFKFLIQQIHKELIKIKTKDLNNEILQRVIRIENDLEQGLKNIEEKLNKGEESFLFFNDSLKAYKERIYKESSILKENMLIQELNEKFRKDKELRFPHRKILEFLLEQYDFIKCSFKEVQYSRLIKKCHIGTNKAKSYFDLLEQKEYIKIRKDGYRIFFRLSG